MSINKHTLSFASGELSEWLDGRSDIAQYDNGCRSLLNLIALPQGAVQKRPGMEHLAMAAGSPVAGKLVDFQVSVTEAVMLVMGANKLEVWQTAQNPAPVLDGDDVPILLTTPWSDSMLPALRYKQINSVVYFVHPEVPPYKLTRYGPNDYVLEAVDYSRKPALLPENIKPEHTITVENGADDWASGVNYVTGDQVWYFSLADSKRIVYTATSNHTASFANAPDGFAPLWTANVQPWVAGRVYKVGQLVTYPTIARTWKCQKNHTALATAPPTTATYTYTLTGSITQGPQTVTKRTWIESFSDQSVPEGGVVRLKASLDTWQAGHVGSVWEIARKRAAQNYEVRMKIPETMANSPSVSNPIIIQGGWQILTTGNWRGTWSIEKSLDGQTWEEVRSWIGENDRNIDQQGEEEVRCMMRLRWVRSPNANTTGVNAEVSGTLSSTDAKIRGLVRITAVTNAREARAEVLTPVELGTTYYWSETAWNEVQGYPRAIELHQQRIVLAATEKRPHTVWGSSTDDYENFKIDTEADAAFNHTIAIGEKDPILWMVSDRVLLVGTGSGEFSMWGEDQEKAITPESGNARRHSSHGCHNGGMPAIFTDSTTLFVQRGGTRIREMSYRYETDRFEASNLTILADHLFTAPVEDIAVQRMPWQVVWFVSAGKLYGLTYELKQQIVGWHRHETAGEVLAVGTIRGVEMEDEVWFLVNRGDGISIERFRPGHMIDKPPDDGWWTDGSVEVPISDITGAAHLQGKTVWGFTAKHAYPDEDFNSAGGWAFTTYAELKGSDAQIYIGFYRFMGLRNGLPWYQSLRSADVFTQRVPDFADGQAAWVFYAKGAPFLVCFDGGNSPLEQEWQKGTGGPADAQFVGMSAKPGDDLGIVSTNNPLYMEVLRRDGTSFGRPMYGPSANVRWTGGAWEYGTDWYSSQDVQSPDLVTVWIPNEGATGNPPVFTRHVAEGDDTNVVIGLPYSAHVLPMTPEIPLQNGSSRTREIRIHRIVPSLRNTRGGKFGQRPDSRLDPLDVGGPDGTFTGEVEKDFPGTYGTSGDFCFVSDEPYPFALRSVAIKFNVFGDNS